MYCRRPEPIGLGLQQHPGCGSRQQCVFVECHHRHDRPADGTRGLGLRVFRQLDKRGQHSGSRHVQRTCPGTLQ